MSDSSQALAMAENDHDSREIWFNMLIKLLCCLFLWFASQKCFFNSAGSCRNVVQLLVLSAHVHSSAPAHFAIMSLINYRHSSSLFFFFFAVLQTRTGLTSPPLTSPIQHSIISLYACRRLDQWHSALLRRVFVP
jgi:hypothetical protein